MILEKLGITKKTGVLICATIISVSLLSTAVIYARIYYDAKEKIDNTVEYVKEKKDAVGEAFDKAEDKTRKTWDKLAAATPESLKELRETAERMMEAQIDQRMCVVRHEIDSTVAECGLHVFETVGSCYNFREWLYSHNVDWHGKNDYFCKDASIVEKCESVSSDGRISESCFMKETGGE